MTIVIILIVIFIVIPVAGALLSGALQAAVLVVYGVFKGIWALFVRPVAYAVSPGLENQWNNITLPGDGSYAVQVIPGAHGFSTGLFGGQLKVKPVHLRGYLHQDRPAVEVFLPGGENQQDDILGYLSQEDADLYWEQIRHTPNPTCWAAIIDWGKGNVHMSLDLAKIPGPRPPGKLSDADVAAWQAAGFLMGEGNYAVNSISGIGTGTGFHENNLFLKETLKAAERDRTAVWFEIGTLSDSEPVVYICVATCIVGYRKKSNSESLYQAVATRNRLNGPLKCWARLEKRVIPRVFGEDQEEIILHLDIPATAASVMAH